MFCHSGFAPWFALSSCCHVVCHLKKKCLCSSIVPSSQESDKHGQKWQKKINNNKIMIHQPWKTITNKSRWNHKTITQKPRTLEKTIPAHDTEEISQKGIDKNNQNHDHKWSTNDNHIFNPIWTPKNASPLDSASYFRPGSTQWLLNRGEPLMVDGHYGQVRAGKHDSVRKETVSFLS